jgi:hypothetical protein
VPLVEGSDESWIAGTCASAIQLARLFNLGTVITLSLAAAVSYTELAALSAGLDRGHPRMSAANLPVPTWNIRAFDSYTRNGVEDGPAGVAGQVAGAVGVHAAGVDPAESI